MYKKIIFSAVVMGAMLFAFTAKADTEGTTQVVIENSFALCHDAIDNDDNTLTDAADPSCADFLTAPVDPTPAPTPIIGGRSGGSRGGSVGASTDNLPTGPAVLGASTSTLSCEPYLTTYLKKGEVNNKADQVKKLQTFLNEFIGSKLPVTGYFGSLTDTAVRNLQTKYSDEIIKPWVQANLMSSIHSTGWVYKTTQWFINSKKCSQEAIPFPVLN